MNRKSLCNFLLLSLGRLELSNAFFLKSARQHKESFLNVITCLLKMDFCNNHNGKMWVNSEKNYFC